MKYLIFILFGISLSAQSQNLVIEQHLDKVKKLSRQKPSVARDSLLILDLGNLCKTLIYFRNHHAKQWIDSLETKASQSKWKPALGILSSTKGYYELNFNDNYTKALSEYQSAERILKDSRIELGKNYGLLSLAMMWNHDLDKTKRNLRADGIRYAQRMYQIGRQHKNASLMSLGLVYEANFYFDSAQYALTLLNKAEALQPADDYIEQISCYNTFAGIYAKLRNESKMNEYLQKAQTIAQRNQDLFGLQIVYRSLTYWYLEYKENPQPALALVNAQKGLQITRKLNILEYTSRAEEMMYMCHKKLRNADSALYYMELHLKHENQLAREKAQSAYSNLESQIETEKQKNQIKTLENEQLMQNRNFLILSVLFGLCFLVYVFFINRKLKTQNTSLSQKNKEIEEALLKGQTIERKRVAAELHDNLSAKISGIRLRLEAIQPEFAIEKQRKIYEVSVNALAEVYTDVRLISHNLLPDELETKGLPAAIEKLMQELNSLGKTQFNYSMGEHLGRFSNKIEYEIYSIILELSNNILKHSKATESQITIQQIDQKLHLTVTDNGIGLPENTQGKGMGMDNVQSRVSALNGKITIESQEGVKVRVEVPV